VRTVDWAGDHLVIVEQTLLPHELRYVELRTVDEVIDAIKRLAVRGAPAIGVTGALGVALAVQQDPTTVQAHAARIRAARPTAVNLAWAVDRVLACIDRGGDPVAEAVSMIEEDIEVNRALGNRGADLVGELCGVRPVTIHTHCNAGGLACVEWGTALGVVRALHDRRLVREVMVDETRPLLQGSRITAFELAQMGIAHRVIVDGAAASVLAGRVAGVHVDVVVVGADRVAANGDVCNKVGTYPLALAAQRSGVPFIVAAPESTLDLATPSGDAIEIELRSPREVVAWDTPALNPAFDVTPADLVTAIVTERRVLRPAAPAALGLQG
jgi:methylthioribose-1-phosphate isomerase